MDRWEARSLLVEGHIGLGTPYGAIGAAFVADLVPEFGLVAGGGLGFRGLQVAAGIRARVPLGTIALGTELVWSGGPYEWKECRGFCFDQEHSVKRWDFAQWLNLSPALEVRAEGGFSARFYVGVAKLLNPGDGNCVGADECDASEILPFIGVALGAAF